MRCGSSFIRDLIFLSTPSARRATAANLQQIANVGISIHALREEGDEIDGEKANAYYISIHALREEGDVSAYLPLSVMRIFLSTPSARRATFPCPQPRLIDVISIHALREEDDASTKLLRRKQCKFLSTPSARRATKAKRYASRDGKFLSTPSARRATQACWEKTLADSISIHALREEGDVSAYLPLSVMRIFLSTPSARRATTTVTSLTG